MKIFNKSANCIICTLLAFPVFLTILSAAIIISYSNSALAFLFGQ